MGLHIADYAVLAVYFLFLLIVGLNQAFKIKNTGDFFLPRKFGKVMMIMFSFTTGTHSDQAVGVCSKSFTNGVSGIWYQWLYLFATPFYWLIAALMRRFRSITMADVLNTRFGVSVSMLFAVFGIWHLVVTIGLMLRSSAEVMSSSTNEMISVNLAIIVMTVMFGIFGVIGGMAASIIVGFLQGVLIIGFSFFLLPWVLYKIGGLQGLHEKLTDPALLSMVTPKDISLFYLIVISIVALIGTGGMPSIIAAGGAGKTELDGRVGMTGGNFLKRLCTIPWCLTGVAAIIYYSGKQIHPDKVFGALANECLTGIMPGLLGVFIAATMAAVMSGCSAFMVSSAALFTENFYKVFVLNKNASHYVLVGRIASIAVVGCGVAFALWVRDVPKGLEIFWAVSTMISIAFWMGIFWRRTTEVGAWAATLAAVAAWWLSTQAFFISYLSTLPLKLVVIKETGPEMYLPWQMIFYLTAGILGGIIGSLLTKPLPEKRLDDFYALLRTPVQPGEKPSATCTLPEGVVPAPRRNLLPFKSLEIPVPSKVAMIGFLASWAVAGALVYAVYLIITI